MEGSFVCPRCGNRDPRYLGFKKGETYCRRCLGFTGETVSYEAGRPKNVVLSLGYKLSKEQERLSSIILDNYISGLDTLVYAVCGAGKTELSYKVISYAVSMGQKVGFALPRRDVVIELEDRIKSAFPDLKVVSVYGGHDDDLAGDIVILTTHQLYRYTDYFDLLVMDEVDAFPFKGNDVLQEMFKRSLKGHYVKMSATAGEEDLEEHRKEGKAIVELKTRFHKQPIPVPVYKECIGITKIPYLIHKLRGYSKVGKPSLVFVPTVEQAYEVYQKIRLFCPGGDYVTSQKGDRAAVIARFKKGGYKYLVTTAVLERGVTIKDLQVIVYQSDHPIYDEASLVQIAGRAGRKKDAPKGEVVFLADRNSGPMEKAIKEIRSCNAHLQMLL